MKILKAIVKSLNETKLDDLKIYQAQRNQPFYEYAVIATANSSRQLLAAVNKLRKDVEDQGIEVRGIEGLDGGFWVLLDLNDVIVNIFIEEERTKYDLDKLWRTLPQVEVKDLV